MKILSRGNEIKIIRDLLASDKPKLVATYGRRRIGKTFLISNLLTKNSAATYFELTGALKENGDPIPEYEVISQFLLNFYQSTGERKPWRTCTSASICWWTLQKPPIRTSQYIYFWMSYLG